ncbi:MAG: HAD family hydrolase [Roseburia sp.]|nr:HAD family hydrolase [Roseburia sp.]MBQ8518266.1 HAD family hydrolase [Agathobacter sp.]
MSIKVVLFDLDGTLLPMDQDTFIKAYLGGMAKKLAPHGYEPEKLVKAVYAGMKAMTTNDGSCTNEEAFWNAFTGLLGEKVREDIPIFDDYYLHEFQEVKNICGFLPEAAKTIQTLKEKGFRVALATTPMFPSIATESRIRWAGLTPEDFEIFTTYENYHFCKPNLNYYREVVEKLGVKPEECLMVGNDVGEDMITEELGMKVFLMPADLINKVEKDIAVYPQGDFADLLAYIDTL